MIELPFQKYNIFKKWRSNAQEKLAEVKNRTSNFDCKNRKLTYIKTEKYLHQCLDLGTNFSLLLSNQKNTSVCSSYGQKSCK